MARTFNKSNWPDPDPAIEAALGRFIIAWAVLEQQMDFAINEMSGLDHDLNSSITANLGTKAKIDMYQAMAHCMKSVIGDDVLKDIDSIAGATGNASGQRRNFLVHGQPFVVALPESKFGAWMRFSARKGGVRGTMVRLSGQYVEDQVAIIKSLIDQWIAVRTKAYKELALYDAMPDEWKRDDTDEGD